MICPCFLHSLRSPYSEAYGPLCVEAVLPGGAAAAWNRLSDTNDRNDPNDNDNNDNTTNTNNDNHNHNHNSINTRLGLHN